MKRLLVSALLLGGCTAGATLFPADGEAEPARGVPEQFLVGTPNGRARLEATPGSACRGLMVDPRDGARLRLVRSRLDRGDYDVPTGRYGVDADKLLRLECGTGRVVGIVPR